jgi:hypothetical protein
MTRSLVAEACYCAHSPGRQLRKGAGGGRRGGRREGLAWSAGGSTRCRKSVGCALSAARQRGAPKRPCSTGSAALSLAGGALHCAIGACWALCAKGQAWALRKGPCWTGGAGQRPPSAEGALRTDGSATVHVAITELPWRAHQAVSVDPASQPCAAGAGCCSAEQQSCREELLRHPLAGWNE